MKYKTRKVESSRVGKIDFDHLGFGEIFSDHMFRMDYEHGGWLEPEILPFGKIEVLPSLSTLHYGQSVFEGLKAFRARKGGINVFRPDKHAERMWHSSDRLCIPRVDKDIFLTAVDELIRLDQTWVPSKVGTALYIRPFTFATEDYIGVRVSEKYSFFIITGPVGAYYKEGFNPVSLMTSGDFVRAVRGGLGEAKTAANYAASLLPAYEAKKRGFAQVLWLDALEEKYIDEVGTMNMCFVKDNVLITPPLEGTILAGITRDSVLHLARHWGIKVEERRISIDEVLSSIKDGSMTEAFGTGTAAVISPVGKIYHRGETVTLNDNRTGPLAQRLFDEITGIQSGERADPFGWVHRVGI
ncbi:MAG: branched-chain amino acid aminotransferase [Methanomassiliicoccus sp.]|nr:branched-chain amino acid aminotransferase [Methanomassiliicoccus sp.]